MTQEDTAKALKLLSHADVMAAGQDAHTTRAEQRLVLGTNGPQEVAS